MLTTTWEQLKREFFLANNGEFAIWTSFASDTSYQSILQEESHTIDFLYIQIDKYENCHLNCLPRLALQQLYIPSSFICSNFMDCKHKIKVEEKLNIVNKAFSKHRL